jgi:hypothetical protein
MTCRIAYAEKDGLILPAGFFEGASPPGIPIHRVIRMLAQVGGEGVGEVVGHRVGPERNSGKEYPRIPLRGTGLYEFALIRQKFVPIGEDERTKKCSSSVLFG